MTAMKLSKSIKDAIKKYLEYSMREMFVSRFLWDEIEQIAQDTLDEMGGCYLDFDDTVESGATTLLSLGEAVQSVPVDLTYDDAWNLAGLDKFIRQLQEHRKRLAAEKAVGGV